ncbi:MAG: hypothetical protein J6Z02_01050 [Lachnospiraceae bacterium]|nr:hypothetical protein [Lachnospiraceae bacterium]
MGNKLLFIFVLALWAADDMINTSVHIGMLIIGSIMVTAGVFYGGMTTGSLLFCLLPGILIALAKIAGAGIGGADIWAVFVSGIVSGPAETFKAFLVGLALFTAIKRKGKGAFLPYYLFGYIGALFI